MTAKQKAQFLGLVRNAAASLTEEIVDMLDQNPHVLIPSVHLRRQLYRSVKNRKATAQEFARAKEWFLDNGRHDAIDRFYEYCLDHDQEVFT